MRKIAIFSVIYILLLVVIIPFAAVNITKRIKGNNVAQREPFETVMVYITAQDKVVEMNTSQYLKEVVGAEMPAEFSREALKAQAVAARTYLCSKIQKHEQAPEHKGASICTDYTHCKAWLSEKYRRAKWESDKEKEYWAKISKAVEETAGEIITYEGEPISAVFHSTSSGVTENAGDVWQSHVPYLVSVQSKGDLMSPKYNSEYSCTKEEFKTIVESNIDNTDWNSGLYTDIVRSEAGGIIKLKLGGVEVRGTTLRTIFELRSANVEFEETEDRIVMKTKGYGHGVGMSQYGANFMAENGSSYVDILKYYYTGVEIGYL